MSLDNLKKVGAWVGKCKKILLNPENINPFPKPPIATNFYNNPPLFCFGRDERIEDIMDEIKDSIQSFEPKLIKVMGKQGIGKSTLICWSANRLKADYNLPIIYLETSGQPHDFKMMSLYRQIFSKIEKDDYIKLLLITSITKFLKIFQESGGKLYEALLNKFSGEEINKILKNPEYIHSKINDSTFTQKIFDLLNSNIMLLKDFITFDFTFLNVFWKAHLQNPEILTALNAFKGNAFYKGYRIETDNDASKYLDDFIEFNRWTFDENTTLVIIFDHLEAGISELKEKVYSNLFSLLLNLRQKKFITIILSGTMDAYNEMDNVLQSDQEEQLNNWAKTLSLINLEPNIVIQIINQYLAIFWSQFNYQPPPSNVLFPFGQNSVKYLYENNQMDLRKSLRHLYELIEKYRKNETLEYIDTFFKAFKAFRKRDDVKLSFTEQRELRNKILDSTIQDKTRSTNAELVICNFFEILRNYPDYNYISDVRHEPPLGKSKKKPDIFLEFFGNEGSAFIKKYGIEVKIFRKGKEVPKADIEKTYVLLKENAVDYVSWITNVPLDLKYRYSLPKKLDPHLGRISPLNDLELSYLSFMVYFEEIYERSPNLEEVELILTKLNLNPIQIKTTLKGLDKITKIEPQKTIPEITSFGTSTVTSTIGNSEIKTPESKIPSVTVESIEIGYSQIKEKVRDYVNEKSTKVSRITCANTIKAVKDKLKLVLGDKKWDEDIWAYAIEVTKGNCQKQTTKTIFFN